MNKNKKYKINSKVVTLGVIAIVVLINLFVSLLVDKFPIKLDMTSEKIFELSEQTKDMLAEYDVPVEIFYVAGSSYETSYRDVGNVAEVLEKYAQYCSDIKYTSIDATKNPTFGTEYVEKGETINVGSVILDAGERYKVYSYADFYNQDHSVMKVEQVMNSALKFLASKEVYTACYIKGHGESQQEGLRKKLTDENYSLSDVNLATEEIPADAKLLIISTPKVDYTTAEIAKLDAFFANAGKAIVTFDYKSSGLTNLYEYLNSWGIAVNDDIAVETSQSHMIGMYGQLLALAGEYTDNDITKNLMSIGRPVANQPYSKSLEMLFESNNGITTTPIITTSDKAFSTTDFENLENVSGNTGKIVLSAVAVKEGSTPAESAAIFVSGNDALWFASEDEVAGQLGFANYDYAMNILSYLQGSYEDFSITPKYLTFGDRLTINQVQAFVMGGIFALILPLIILIYGIIVWFRRRHL